MKKKKKNIERALKLKSNILNFNHLINLPQIDDINLKENHLYYNVKTNKIHIGLINGINNTYFHTNLINDYLHLESDNLIGGRTMKDVLIKTKRILLLPTDEQKQKLILWMDAWITMYNKVLSLIKKERKLQSQQQNKVLSYDKMNLDNLEIIKLKKDLKSFKKNLHDQTSIDQHVLDNCIKDVLSMLQSSISNLETKNFKKSKLRYIKKTKKSKIFKVEYNSIRDFSFCTSVLGKKIKTIPEVNFKKVNSRITTIQYINGKFYMLAKVKIKIEKHPIKEQKVISLDPGHRTFLTGLSNDHLIEIGNGIDKKIKKKLLKMDKIKEKRNKHPKYKRRKKRKYLLRHEKKITNYINNLHWQSINYLTANYNHILLGNYSTSLYYIKSLFSKRGVDKFINTFIFIFYYVFFCFLLSTLV